MLDEHALPAAGEFAAPEAHHPHVNYWKIFYVLCVLTIISWLADEFGKTGNQTLLVLVVLTVACFKAMFVMLYFMHLKFEGKWKFVLLAPTMILALAIVAALMPDIGSHYYDYDVPQLHTADTDDEGHAEHSSGGHGDALPGQ